MEDAYLVAVLVASFVLVIGLIQAINRMLERDIDRGNLADEPPDAGTPDYGDPGNGAAGPSGWPTVTAPALPARPREQRPPKVRR
jgi:hypothetical protein